MTAESSAIKEIVFELPGYSDLKRVGQGGMAIVYSATQQAFDRKVAIKVLLPSFTSDPEFSERFMREAKIVASLSHPNIIPVYDFGKRDNIFYMVMEYLAGGDLNKRIKNGLKEQEILQITSEVASALHFAHQKGFIHRDVKPDNIMFRENGSAVLTDFGIARKQDGNTQMTKVGQTVGTPRYMSPQQLQGRQVDGRTDIYSLGIMFYEMFMKQTPYQDEDFMALALKHLQAPIPKFPAEYMRYQKLFERMVAKEQEKRFQTGDEIVQLIRQIQSGKVDATSIESGAAVVLKKAVAASDSKISTGGKEKESSARKAHIPREILIALQDMDPLFDKNWSKLVSGVFTKLDSSTRLHVYDYFLQPKGIVLDQQRKQFVFRGRPSVQEIAAEVVRNPGLQTIAQKIIKIETVLRSTAEIGAFADAVESGLSQIDHFDAQDNLAAQKEKLILRHAFLDDLVPLVREANFALPATRRGLNLDSIKSYMIDVYLKHEMLGYRFKTHSYAALEDDPDPFIRSVITKEARIRQCDVVRTETTLYLIGSTKDSSQNPYSIRRFLQEDSTMAGQVVYFNVVAVPLASVRDINQHEAIKWQLSRIVTLERQLSMAIKDLVEKMEITYRNELRPLLIKELAADGTNIEEAIARRLGDYERRVSLQIIGKLPKALREQARTQDDYDYLFINLRRLIIDLACDVRDFAAQSSTMWSDRAEQMDYRLMAFLTLIDKRKQQLFSGSISHPVDAKADPDLLMQELRNVLAQHKAELEVLDEKLRVVIAEQAVVKSKFRIWLDDLLGLNRNKVTPDHLHEEIGREKTKCLLSIIRIIKRYPVIAIYLEFESIAPIEEGIRHYALSAGKDGLARLPLLIKLHEKVESINLAAIEKMLLEDVFKNSSWQGGTH